MRSSAKQLADLILGEHVEQWMTKRANDGRSLRGIAEDLKQATEGKVDITHSTVSLWLSEEPDAAASARAS